MSYLLTPAPDDTLAKKCASYGLRNQLLVYLDDEEPPLIQIGTWCFRPSALFTHNTDTAGGEMWIFLQPLSSCELVPNERGGFALKAGLTEKKKFAKLLAHETKHQIDFQNRFWVWLSRYCIQSFIVEEPLEMNSIRRLLALLSKLLYYLSPIEMRARWHATRRWGAYYHALWGRTYLSDWIESHLPQPSPEEMIEMLYHNRLADIID